MEIRNIYETPLASVVEFQAEGILCESGVAGVLDQLIEEEI